MDLKKKPYSSQFGNTAQPFKNKENVKLSLENLECGKKRTSSALRKVNDIPEEKLKLVQETVNLKSMITGIIKTKQPNSPNTTRLKKITGNKVTNFKRQQSVKYIQKAHEDFDLDNLESNSAENLSKIGDILAKNDGFITKQDNLIRPAEKKADFRFLQQFNNVNDSLSEDEDFADRMEEVGFIIMPNSPFKKAWDALIGCLCLYIFIFTPIYLAFPGFISGFGRYSEFAIDILFILDLILQFFIPYKNIEEILILNKAKIASNYLKTNFFLDLIACFPFAIFFSEENDELGSIFRFAKFYRMLKLLKFMKALRLLSASGEGKRATFIEEFKIGEKKRRILQFFFWLSLFSHVLACFNIFLKKSDLEFNFGGSDWDLYIESTYFILSSIYTIGYGDITPSTSEQRVFVLLLMMFGVFIYSYAVSSLGTIISSYDFLTAKYLKNVAIVDRIKKENNIPVSLYKRINQFLNYNRKFNASTQYDFIKELPKRARSLLIFSMHKDMINNSIYLNNRSKEFVTKVIMKMKPVRMLRKEYLIHEGDYVHEIYFLREGSISINLNVKYEEAKIIELGRHEYFGDILCLSNQRSPFNVKINSATTDIMVVTKQDMEEIVNEFPEDFDMIYKISSYNFAMLLVKMKEKINKIEEMQMENKAEEQQWMQMLEVRKAEEVVPILMDSTNSKYSNNSSGARLVEVRRYTKSNTLFKNKSPTIKPNVMRKISSEEENQELSMIMVENMNSVMAENREILTNPVSFFKREINQLKKEKEEEHLSAMQIYRLSKVFDYLRGKV